MFYSRALIYIEHFIEHFINVLGLKFVNVSYGKFLINLPPLPPPPLSFSLSHTQHTHSYLLSGLDAATRYRYKVLFTRVATDSGGAPPIERTIERSGEVMTFPRKGQRSEWSFVFGSCLSPSPVPMFPLATLLSQVYYI